MKPPRVEIDTDQLGANIRAICTCLRPGTRLITVVKSDAYGHGLAPVVGESLRQGMSWFSLASVSEALQVRALAPDAEILVIGAVDDSHVPALFEHRIVPSVIALEQGRAWSAAAAAAGRRLPVHLKIDTGMGRLGFPWPEAAEACTALLREPGLEVRGICSHLAGVEPGVADPARAQAERFFGLAEAADAQAGRRLFRHLSNSRGILFHPEWDFDGVRTGIALYGYGAEDPEGRMCTRPFLQWKGFVAQVKKVPAGFPVGYDSTYVTPAPTTLATLAIGYADGYPRLLGNRATVLIGGNRCPVVGRVSMNWIVADTGPEAGVSAGDEAVLIGRQGEEEIWADELAALCDTIPYEILTGIHPRHERVEV